MYDDVCASFQVMQSPRTPATARLGLSHHPEEVLGTKKGRARKLTSNAEASEPPR